MHLKGNHAVGGFWHWTFGTYFSSQWLKTDSPVYFDDDMNKMLSNKVISSDLITRIKGSLDSKISALINTGYILDGNVNKIEQDARC